MAVTALPTPEPDDNEILEFDVNSLTLGEAESLEDIIGRDHMRTLERGDPSIKALVALVYVMKRRDNPDFTLDDARRLKVTAIRATAVDDPKETGASDA